MARVLAGRTFAGRPRGHLPALVCQSGARVESWRLHIQLAEAGLPSGGGGLLEVLEVDILWPRWVARIGVTRSTQACFLAADRQCTELPLLRLPRLVPEVVGCDPFVPRDLARVGWRGLAPFLPIGPHERPRLADSFPRLGQARGASPGSLDQRSEEWPLCEGKSGALGVRLVRPPPRGEGNCGVPTGASVRPSRPCDHMVRNLVQRPQPQGTL